MPTVRILVVDDHATVRRTMCSLLSTNGLEQSANVSAQLNPGEGQ